MSKFNTVTQRTYSASPGSRLVDVVDFTAVLSGFFGNFNYNLGNVVNLVDVATGAVICSHQFGPTLTDQTISNSMPVSTDVAVYMPSSGQLLLQVQVGPLTIIPSPPDQVVQLQPISSGGGIIGNLPPDQQNAVIVLGAVAGLAFVGLGVRWYQRRRR